MWPEVVLWICCSKIDNLNISSVYGLLRYVINTTYRFGEVSRSQFMEFKSNFYFHKLCNIQLKKRFFRYLWKVTINLCILSLVLIACTECIWLCTGNIFISYTFLRTISLKLSHFSEMYEYDRYDNFHD